MNYTIIDTKTGKTATAWQSIWGGKTWSVALCIGNTLYHEHFETEDEMFAWCERNNFGYIKQD